VVVRRKSRQFGIWMNTEAFEIKEAPSFYAVASTSDLAEILGDSESLLHRIRINRMLNAGEALEASGRARDYLDALVRIRESRELYVTHPVSIEFLEDTLFSTQFALPSNLTKGTYSARIYFVRNQEVIDVRHEDIVVQQVGLGRWIYDLAHEQPLLYGFLALTIAILAGWLASMATRFVARISIMPRTFRSRRR